MGLAKRMIATAEVREAVALSTCNRTELYLVVGDPVRAETDALAMLARHAGIDPTELAREIYTPRNCDAARQLFRVTAGLESMIVGEAEIQGQVKRAFEAALRAGCTRAALEPPLGRRAEHRQAGALGDRDRRSHREHPLRGGGPRRGGVGGPHERHVVILGAGETSELTARALADRGAGTIFVANRHADRARSLAQRFGGSVVGLEGLPEQLAQADIVVSSTSSHPIVGHEELELVLGQREGRPLLLIDIAVPRDIEPRCGELEGVTLYDIDDLQEVVARNLSTRAGEVPRAHEIVEEEIRRFAGGSASWRRCRRSAPCGGTATRSWSRCWRRTRAAGSPPPRDLVRVEALARSIANRILHEPTIRLRSLSETRGHASLQLVRELFGLQEEAPEERAPPAKLAEVHDLRRRREH